MTHPSSLIANKVDGDQLFASEIDAMDATLIASLPRSGTTPLTGATVIDNSSFDLTFQSAAKLKLGSHSVFRVQRGAALSSTAFAFDPTSALYQYKQTATQSGANGILTLPLVNTIDGADIIAIRVFVAGRTFVALPAAMPGITLYKVLADGTVSSIAFTSDASSTVAIFNAPHSIDLSGFTETIDNSSGASYLIELVGAGGANYVNNAFVCAGARAAFTVTKLTPG